MKKQILTSLTLGATLVFCVGTTSAATAAESGNSSNDSGKTTTVRVDGVNHQFNVFEVSSSDQPALVANSDGTLSNATITNNGKSLSTTSAITTVGAAQSTTSALTTSYGWVAPGDLQWHTSVNGAALFGSPGYVTSYVVTGNSGSIGSASIQVRGYKVILRSDGTQYTTEYWQSIGTVGKGQITGKVVWGNNASYKRIKMKAVQAGIGHSGTFQ